jgi:hypothetical protein
MTKNQINDAVMKESKKWLDVGSGKLGRVFVEILGCDNLPNLDIGGFLGNKTDAFVSLVFEDACVRTDVIDDCLSPRWLPWSQRAFIFHMMHSSSHLFLGVFDYDLSIVDDHDLIGRVSIDLTNMRPDTEYLLYYNIYDTAKVSNRKSKGTISIRVRIEIEDEQKLLLRTLEPPPPIYVNVKKKKDFHVVRYTCTGSYDTNKYSMKTINSHIEELLSHLQAWYYVEDALKNVLLWRGHFPINIRIPGKVENVPEHAGFFAKYTKQWTTIKLPIHSLNAFLVGTMLVEKPTLAPSVFCVWIAWLLVAVMGYRRNNPNPWYK